MFDWLHRKRNQDLFAGVSLHADGVAGAMLRAMPDGAVRLEQACWMPSQGKSSALELIPSVLKQCRAANVPLTAVMAPDSYALIQIEKPDIPEEELQEALRWRIKDMVEFPVQDAVIDSFPLPKSLRPGAPDLAYVVATPAATIDELSGTLIESGAALKAIDIPELALRDLVMHTGKEGNVHAYLYLKPGQALIEISGAEEIFITRHIPLEDQMLEDWALDDLAPEDESAQLARMEALVLEVQRSLDYFESQFARGSIDQLFLLSSSERAEQSFMQSALLYLTVPVEALALEALQGTDKLEQQTLRHVYLALGAAIREMPCAA